MAFYTERHGLRKNIALTDIVTIDMYTLLFEKCKQYFDNIAWKYPDECSNGHGCSGIDERKLTLELKFLIPDLFGVSDAGKTAWKCCPVEDVFDSDQYDQYSLFDFIEFIYNNIRDITTKTWHSYMQHNHLKFSDTRNTCNDFLKDINDVFLVTGLQYKLSDDGKVERVISDTRLIEDTFQISKGIEEQGLKELLIEAINTYKMPRNIYRSQAIEKIWDAFERLKTYYGPGLDKKSSANKLIHSIAGNNGAFESLLQTEFKFITDIGNQYRIRH